MTQLLPIQRGVLLLSVVPVLNACDQAPQQERRVHEQHLLERYRAARCVVQNPQYVDRRGRAPLHQLCDENQSQSAGLRRRNERALPGAQGPVPVQDHREHEHVRRVVEDLPQELGHAEAPHHERVAEGGRHASVGQRARRAEACVRGPGAQADYMRNTMHTKN